MSDIAKAILQAVAMGAINACIVVGTLWLLTRYVTPLVTP